MSLLKRHEEYIAQFKPEQLTNYDCPHCDYVIFCLKPGPGDQFDSMTQCPNCSELHFKIVSENGTVKLRYTKDGVFHDTRPTMP